jgi:nitroimidazol reductase NimA-like FMN-containing flavoprotein (pyridoxamine 5'-phosphate oxidase superfamily)
VREVRWQELTREECFELLAGQHLGRVVLVDDRGPLALPVVRSTSTLASTAVVYEA